MHTLLGTGLRREELVNFDLDQVTLNTPEALRAAKKAKISSVRGKGCTSRTEFLGADGRTALADYLEHERPRRRRAGRCRAVPVRRLDQLPPPRRPALATLDQPDLRTDRRVG